MTGDRLYLQHILDAIDRIERYVSVGRDEFFAESHWQDGVIRQLEIIGEATKRLSDQIRSHYPNVPWRRIAGLRDVLIHNYMGVDLNAVWEITQRDVPWLRQQVQTLVRGLDDVRAVPAALMGPDRRRAASALHPLRL